MERSSHHGGLSPQQKIAYAQYLFKKNSPQGRYEGVTDVAKDALEHIDDLTRTERLRLFMILMQSPMGRLTPTQKKILAADTIIQTPSPPAPMLIRQYLLRTYHGLPVGDISDVCKTAQTLIESEDGLNETKSFAHVLKCAYGDRLTESIDWLNQNGDEFSLTEGVRRASRRMNSGWRAQMRLDEALDKVRHPVLRARLLAKRIEIYTKMLCNQEKEYDPRVNEHKDVIVSAIREAFLTVRRTAGAIVPQVESSYHIGCLYAQEGKHDAARRMFAQAIEVGEIYGLTHIAGKAREAMQRVSQPD